MLKRLDQVATVIMGQSPDGSTYNNEGIGEPLLNGPTEFGSSHPSCSLFTTDSKRECQAGDLLFCVRGSTTGRMNWADRKYSLGRGVCAIRGQTSLETKFIKYCIDWRLENLLVLAGGGTFPNLTKDTILGFEIPFPEARFRIASILSAYDDLIENNTRRIAILEEMARRIYEEWFVRFRFPGHEQVKMVESELGAIPEGWEVGCLKNVVRLLSGFAFKTQDFVEDGAYGLVTIKNVQHGEFVTECTSRLDAIPKKMASHCELKTGDCLLSLTGNVGRCCTVIGHNYLLNQRVAKLNPVRTGDKAYVYFLFRSETTRKSLEAISNGVAQQNLSPIQTENLPWIIPSVGIRSEFDAVVAPMLDLGTTLRLKNSNLRATRDLLLPKLISGELDVSTLPEPEEALAA